MSFTTPFRPIITVVRRAPDESELEVTLDLDGWIADGVSVVAPGGSAIEAACRATCQAVNGFLPAGIEVVFGQAQHLQGDRWAREIVFSTVVLRDGDDDQRHDELLGAAFVRSDPQVAAVRATLDGLSRRLAPYLEG